MLDRCAEGRTHQARICRAADAVILICETLLRRVTQPSPVHGFRTEPLTEGDRFQFLRQVLGRNWYAVRILVEVTRRKPRVQRVHVIKVVNRGFKLVAIGIAVVKGRGDSMVHC